jgi:hypothetical protein
MIKFEIPYFRMAAGWILAVGTIPAAVQEKEKKLLDGFLTGKARLMEDSQKVVTQRKLFD